MVLLLQTVQLSVTAEKASGGHLVETPLFPDKENETPGPKGRAPKCHSQLAGKAKSCA